MAGIQLFGDRNNVQKYAEHVDLCIDHHPSNNGYAYETLLDPGAAATCEIMIDVVTEMGVEITPDIAACLYTGIALFESRSRARLEIEKMALESLEYFFGGLCAMIYLTWDQIVTSGVPGAELEDLTSLPRSIEGVEVGLTLRQQKDGSFKISVRTAGRVDACAIARHLGRSDNSRAAG